MTLSVYNFKIKKKKNYSETDESQFVDYISTIYQLSFILRTERNKITVILNMMNIIDI